MNENRFTGKAESYKKYRPSYPKEIIGILQKECRLNPQSIVADLGAGTGIFTDLIAPHCARVYAVEPNADMIAQIPHKSNIISVMAAAESTTLDSGSIDIITVAQAFHWFDKERARAEFKRILKPRGHVVLLWNNRNTNSPFEKNYDDICNRYKDSYLKKNDRRDSEDDKTALYANGSFKKYQFNNGQELDFTETCGRLSSLSYMPKDGDPEFNKVKREIQHLFDLYATNHKVVLSMRTDVYIGQID